MNQQQQAVIKAFYALPDSERWDVFTVFCQRGFVEVQQQRKQEREQEKQERNQRRRESRLARSHPCPYCGAEPEDWCTTSSGEWLDFHGRSHKARIRLMQNKEQR